MQSYLFNIVQSARHVRDMLTAKGPAYLRNGASLFKELSETLTRVADYVEQFGTATKFVKGSGDDFQGGVDSAEAQTYLAEIAKMRDDAQDQAAQLMASIPQANDAYKKQLQVGVEAGLLDWVGKIDPQITAGAWSILFSLLTRVLIKSGMAPEGAPYAVVPPAKKEDKAAIPASGRHPAKAGT